MPSGMFSMGPVYPNIAQTNLRLCLKSVLHRKAMDSRAGCGEGMECEEAFFVMSSLC